MSEIDDLLKRIEELREERINLAIEIQSLVNRVAELTKEGKNE